MNGKGTFVWGKNCMGERLSIVVKRCGSFCPYTNVNYMLYLFQTQWNDNGGLCGMCGDNNNATVKVRASSHY